MVKDINAINESLFESIKHINEYGMEYWTARELLKVLQYGEYRFFSKVIDKAIDACIASKNDFVTISCTCTKWLTLAVLLNDD